ncbi:hypothetical protein ABH944_002308 [Caballeronia udeis]|uniref:Uncharacterized protein n=1 Tax=Caballeronia udeis TaxID=1232866 RepID=A0ABW8MV33_9BURK
MATMLLWPTMAILRSGSFAPALLKYENLPDIKGSAVPRTLRKTPIHSAAFLGGIFRLALGIGKMVERGCFVE